jgi:hypothetical protein
LRRVAPWLMSVTGKGVFTLVGVTIGLTLAVGAINLNATLKLIEKINVGPFSGMILNAGSGSCVTIVSGAGNKIETACGKPAEQQPVRVHRLAHEEWEAIDNVPRIRPEKEPQGRLRCGVRKRT